MSLMKNIMHNFMFNIMLMGHNLKKYINIKT